MTNIKPTDIVKVYTQRQRRLLGLEAIYAGTQYDRLEPWYPGVRHIQGAIQRIPCDQRAPPIQLGLITEKVDKLVDKLVAVGKLPTITGISDRLNAILRDEINLEESLYLPALDVVVKGSGCLGFTRPDGMVFESVHIDPTWSEPIISTQASGDRAKSIAAELAAIEGITLARPAPGDHLFVPLDSWQDDVIFLRHEWFWEEEMVAGATVEIVYWRRRVDYTPDMIIEYEDVKALGQGAGVVEWRLKEVPRPHRWGTVPVVWVRARGARPRDIDGPSFITPALVKLDRAADIAASRLDDSIASIAWPQLVEQDVIDVVSEAQNEIAPGFASEQSPLSSEVRRYRSHDASKPGKVSILEISGAGATIGREYVKDLEAHVQRLTGIVEFDQSASAGALSGVAIERMMETTIARVGAYRGRLSEMIRVLAFKIGKVIKEDVTAIKIDWPPIVPPTAQELGDLGSTLMAAAGAAVVSIETASAIFSRAAGIEDPAAEFAKLEVQADERLAAARNAMDIGDPEDDPEAEPAPEPEPVAE